MFSQLLRQRLWPAKASLSPSNSLSQSRKASSFLRPRHHPFFSPSTTRTMNKPMDPLTRLRLQQAQRYYHSGYGPYGVPGKSGVMPAFYFLLATNTLVFGALNYAKYTKDWRLERKLLSNTLLSPAAVDSGRWWTVVTSAFAHIDPVHFAFNMLSLYNFSSLLAFVPGVNGVHLFAIAAGSAISGGLGFLYHRRTKVREAGRDWQRSSQNYNSSALGASGAVMGVGAAAACLVPSARMQFMFIPISFPLWVSVVAYGVIDAYFLDSPTSPIAHAGHLGGLVFGAVYYLAALRKAPVGIWRDVSRLLSRRR